jgi:hypothetical protein
MSDERDHDVIQRAKANADAPYDQHTCKVYPWAAAARIRHLEETIERQLAFMKDLSDALIKVRPLGGSELFVERFDRYFADPKFCSDEIDRLHREKHELWHDVIAERRKAAAAISRS